ncbi:MAG TPA: SDR family NAD(P)-dependent oxidoreductase [Terriglobales bacterium]
MEMGLKGRVAIVAASSQGIGLATAEAFAAAGCRVAMCARNSERLESAAGKIRQYGAEVFAHTLDVTQPAAVHEFVQAVVEQFGGVDICVTNAGGPPRGSSRAAPRTGEKRWTQISSARCTSPGKLSLTCSGNAGVVSSL